MNTPAESPRYFAFISYSHQDETWAQWLHKTLETWRVPKRLVGQNTAAGVIPPRLLPIFRDRDELASATDLGRTVNAALAQSKNLIVICSPASAKSRWVNEEVLAFKRLGHAERIFCLIVGGEPNASDLAGREAEECFAPALRFEIGADGQPASQRTEPIAADAREGKDGKANAKLKLIAGLLDVGFDTLKQRELQRRNRRLAAITVAALIVMVITTTLAITAVIARNDAKRREKQAEDLVGFMLGDLNEKLREVSRLDILQAVDDKAMAYFASLPTKDVTDAALALRVDALQRIGGVREDQGQMPAALESYSAASAVAKELMERAPGDVTREASYANSLTWIGKAYWYQGDLEHAASNFQIASEKLRAAAAARPDDSDLAYRLSSALTNTGRVLETRGEFVAAKPYYEEVKKIFERLSERETEKVQWRTELGYSYNNLGKLALEQGQLAEAVAAYRSDLKIKMALAARDPSNHEVQENLAISNAILGRTLGICGNAEIAKGYLGAAVAGLRTLMVFDSTHTNWAYLFARYGEQLGGLLRQLGEFDASAAVESESLRELEALAAKDATNVEWQQQLAQSRLEGARLAFTRKDITGAEKLIGAARDAVGRLRESAPGNRNLILLSAQTDTVAGDIAASRGDAGAARDTWTRARDAVATLAKTGSDINFLAAWATCLLLLDDLENARPVVSKLAAMGYRTPDFVALTTSKQLDFPLDAHVSQRIAGILKEEPAIEEGKQGGEAQQPTQN
ncbi:MAG TPA: TIR domain-containing protein [Rudaea sp.]|nr:TIR domain-containing protein [Rudaea sp.]